MNTYTILSAKKKRILVHNDFDYHLRLKSRRGDKIYWRCTLRDTCNATCITNADFEVLKVGGTHTHVKRRGDIRVRKVVAAIKQHASNSPNEAPTIILQEEVNQVNDEETLV